MDAVDAAEGRDIAYVGRLRVDDQPMIVIAGIHALGSVGAVDYLARNLPELYSTVGTENFSMVIGSAHDGDVVLSSEALAGPCLHR
jgi:hypothetical protein